MEPAVLRHSTFKIVAFIALGLGVAALGGFVASLPPDEDYHGRSAWLVDLIGPSGVWWLMIGLVVVGILIAIGCVRLLLSGDRTAALADREGVTLQTMTGTRRYRWDEVADVRVETVSTGRGSQHLLRIEVRGRRNAGVSAGTIDGGVKAIETWIEQAAAIHRSLTPASDKASAA